MKVLLWDIDGTLLRANKAGQYTFQQATMEIFQSQYDFSDIPTAGMTDYYIAYQIISKITGKEPDQVTVKRLVEKYEQLLPTFLDIRKGFVIPSAIIILEKLVGNANYLSLLLTGNTLAGAKEKLNYYEIANYFNFANSSFGDGCLERAVVAEKALEKVRRNYPKVLLDDIVVIGDTPQDILCGKRIGVKTVAVATGKYKLSELREYSPWWGIDVLPSPNEFIDKLEQ